MSQDIRCSNLDAGAFLQMQYDPAASDIFYTCEANVRFHVFAGASCTHAQCMSQSVVNDYNPRLAKLILAKCHR